MVADIAQTVAMVSLGLLLRGRGDLAQAETWFRRAAKAGDSDAMVKLGALLEERGDVTQAKIWYRRAANAEHTDIR